MLASYTSEQIDAARPYEMSEALERGRIVYFPVCPVPLPADSDLGFLREALPKQLKLKNISYHPEAGRVTGLSGSPELAQLAHRVLIEHSQRVQQFLSMVIPSLTHKWTVGTSSFRPIQEKGRALKPHASNELVHIDAGAYGATNGDRIFRFFVNVNPHEDRVWATKGTFADLYGRYGQAAGVTPDAMPPNYLQKGLPDHLRTALLKGLSSIGLPLVQVLDSSPYDRLMRRFHNFMKDSDEFKHQEGYREFRFKPFSAWMVFTDMVSHASVSGQHALVNTFLIRLENCRIQELAPINILSGRRPVAPRDDVQF